MEEQRKRARDSGKMEAVDVATILTKLENVDDTRFVGYTQTESTARVQALIDDRFVSLDQTPFYVESGGQVDDIGFIRADGVVAEVIDSFRLDKRIVHEIAMVEGTPALLRGAEVNAVVDKARRMNVQRNHSATHLLHEALRRILGTHLHQHGSLVAPDRLRFDFNHFERITPDQLRAIEAIVNEKISAGIPVYALNDPKDWLSLEEAKRRYPNVKMFFGRQIRRPRPDRGDRSEFLGRIVRRHARDEHRRARPVQDRLGVEHRQRHPANRGGHGRRPAKLRSRATATPQRDERAARST